MSTFYNMAEREVPEEATVNFDFKDILLADTKYGGVVGRGEWREETFRPENSQCHTYCSYGRFPELALLLFIIIRLRRTPWTSRVPAVPAYGVECTSTPVDHNS